MIYPLKLQPDIMSIEKSACKNIQNNSLVSQNLAQTALYAMPVNNWVEAGLIKVHKGQVSSLVKFEPFRSLLLISDFDSAADAVSPHQPVMANRLPT